MGHLRSGHVRPLLPYAHSLRARGHEVRVATPRDAAEMLAAVGLGHIATPRATDEFLRDFWTSEGEISNVQMVAIAIPELFVGISARYALPKLQAQIKEWRPDFVIRDSAEFAAPVGLAAADRETKPIREALGRVLADRTFSSRAADISIEMAALPPVERATELLETVT